MRTVGVEEELLLVDPETGEPRALSAAVLARAERDPADSEVFEKELHGQMLEFATHPQSSLAKLQEEIVRWRADAARHAAGTGAAVAALAAVLVVLIQLLAQSNLVTSMQELLLVNLFSVPQDLSQVTTEEYLSDATGSRIGFWLVTVVLLGVVAVNALLLRANRR